MKVSILIPVYNEEKTICQLISNVLKVDLGNIEREIIVIDDGSTDLTISELKKFSFDIKILKHKKNLGKGAALQTGFLNSSGDVIMVQDADLEYSPEDYHKLLQPFEQENTGVVIGKRCLIEIPFRYRFSAFYLGGRTINLFFNLLSPIKLSDVHSGYKLARRNVWHNLNLAENGFNFCHEFLSKLVINKIKIVEVTISYKPRSTNEGKKIRARDGFFAIKTIVKIFFTYKLRQITKQFQQTNT